MKCTHETSIVISDCTGFSLLRCTWGCGQDLIQLDLGNHTVVTYTASDIAALRAEVDGLREAAAKLLETLEDEGTTYGDGTKSHRIIWDYAFDTEVNRLRAALAKKAG
jgi:hypothetical protein